MVIIQSMLAIVHGILAAALIGLILLQQGKGADAGASFGSGSSATMFGSVGSGNFLTRLTSLLAALFLINCLALGWLGKQQVNRDSLLDQVTIEDEQAADDTLLETDARGSDPDAAGTDVPILPQLSQDSGDGDIPAMQDDTGQQDADEENYQNHEDDGYPADQGGQDDLPPAPGGN